MYVDANVWIPALDPKHDKHLQASQIISRLINKTNISLYVSDYSFSEILSYITRRQKQNKKPYTQQEREQFVKQVYYAVYNSRYVRILTTSLTVRGTAFNYVDKNPSIPASLTDWLSLILMIKHNIPVIQTFDSDFKTIINQITEFNGLQVCVD